MTERETQPTVDNKYTVHSIYDPHIHVHTCTLTTYMHLVMCHITCTVFILVSIYRYTCSYTYSHVSH